MRVEVIAEAGVNHNGSVELAQKLVDEAKLAGADCVKFQAFQAKRLVTTRARKADYQARNEGADGTQSEMLTRLQLPTKAYGDLAEYTRKAGLEFLTTPFDDENLAMLVDLGVRRIKLGSGDVTNAPLLRAVAKTRLPLVLSTGMATLGEVEGAMAVLAAAYLDAEGERGKTPFEALCAPAGQKLLEEKVTLLHCVTEYPAPVEQTNLRAMETLRNAFGVTVGYSDHTPGIAVSLAAVALGAAVIEKHFTLDRKLPGPDHLASLEPGELGELVRGVRVVEQALGTSRKRPGPAERANMKIARRSLVAAVPIAKGTTITAAMVDAKRPSDGLSPMRIDDVVGRTAHRDYAVDDLIEL